MTRLFLGLDTVDRETVVFKSRFHGMNSDQVDESCSFPVDCSVAIPRDVWGTSGQPVHITVDLPDREA